MKTYRRLSTNYMDLVTSIGPQRETKDGLEHSMTMRGPPTTIRIQIFTGVYL